MHWNIESTRSTNSKCSRTHYSSFLLAEHERPSSERNRDNKLHTSIEERNYDQRFCSCSSKRHQNTPQPRLTLDTGKNLFGTLSRPSMTALISSPTLFNNTSKHDPFIHSVPFALETPTGSALAFLMKISYLIFLVDRRLRLLLVFDLCVLRFLSFI